MLGKIAQAGVDGQFRTPRHIIRMMVELVKPRPDDIICDPACGTDGVLVDASEYLREKHPEIFAKEKLRQHLQETQFHGYDFDSSMLRIGSMNLMQHGIDNPDISYRDSLGKDHQDEEEKFTLILGEPRRSPGRSTRPTYRRSCGRSRSQEDGAAVPGALPSAPEDRWARGP